MSKRPSQPLLDAHQRRRIVTHGMVDPDTGEVISPQTAQLQIPPRQKRASTATTVNAPPCCLPFTPPLTFGGERFDMCVPGRPGLSEWLAMSSRDVTNWLRSLRLGAYVDVFAEHNVTWDDLGELGDEDLRKMGLKTRERRALGQSGPKAR